MRKLWEVTFTMKDQQKNVIRLFARSPRTLIQQLSRKHAELIEQSSSIEWTEVIW